MMSFYHFIGILCSQIMCVNWVLKKCEIQQPLCLISRSAVCCSTTINPFVGLPVLIGSAQDGFAQSGFIPRTAFQTTLVD